MKLFFSIIFLILLVVPSNAQNKLQEIRFMTHWLPQAQFAGYYVAFEKGFYKKRGIDLILTHGGPKKQIAKYFAEKKIDFGLMWFTNALQLRDKKIKVYNIAQMINKSALMLVAKKKSGINKIEDMNGKKVGVWGGDYSIQPLSFFEKFGIKIKPVVQGNSINLFLYDGVHITSAMIYNEYHTILSSGINPDELVTFKFQDYGLNFPEEGIYCTEQILKEKPEICKAFLEATLEGWKYAFENEGEALAIVKKYITEYFLPFNEAHQKWMLRKMKELQFPDNDFTGFSKLMEEDYYNVAKILFKRKIINNYDKYNSFYRPLIKDIIR